MERRIYSGTISPADLADYLVQHYEPQENLQAQNISQGGGHAVQIGRGDVPKDLRHAVTVAISEAPDGESGIAVTLGQHQWLTPNMATYAATIGLISVLVTPWALFGLLWPASEAVGDVILPNDIWDTINDYVLSRGGHLLRTEQLEHPHAKPPAG
jgi:hypothetical protein